MKSGRAQREGKHAHAGRGHTRRGGYLGAMHERQGGLRVAKSFMQDEWQPGLYYHVIGKAVPGQTLFRDEVDARWFLKHVLRFKLYHFFEILVYCLCGNHFHLVIRTRLPEAIRVSLQGKPARSRCPADEAMLAGRIAYRAYIHYALRGALSGFARRSNNRVGRSGQLLVQPTLHGLTDKGAPGVEFSRRQAAYVGFNFVKHHIAPASARYPWSSLTNPLYGIVDSAAVVALFEGELAYKLFHDTYLERFGHAFMNFDEEVFYAALQPRALDPDTGTWVERDWLSELDPL